MDSQLAYYRDTWAEINLEHISYNIEEMKRHIGEGVKVFAVVKANAYGHGDEEVAKEALNSGASYLAVAFLDEALALRRKGIEAPILVSLVLYAYLFIILFPTLRWKRWRYEVRENEIELQHGVFVIKRTLVPMIRVQHVDMQQGPILRKYQLATITVSTAATVHEIPAMGK